ncbi:MAG: hypothetical protein IJY22_05645 [Clostridia bacterium]|nr:hypothetical protein [Clostridia bacterium]
MNQIGIKKEVDHLGRLQIPKEIRNLWGLDGAVELVVTSEGLLVKSGDYVLVKKSERI